MRITVAQSAGFCYGVRRAVELAERAARDNAPCVMLGPIIHNKDVIARLAAQGIGVVERPEEVPEGSAVIVRSHGESRAVHEALLARGLTVLNATCPNVTHIHQIVSQAEERGRIPVIVGYDIDGKITDRFPETYLLDRAKPVYEYLDGWKTDISDVKEYDDLPDAAKAYVEFIEKQLGVSVTLVSNGPKRSHIIYRGFSAD